MTPRAHVPDEQADPPGLDRLRGYFASRGWAPFEFQVRAWRAYVEGRSGLIHAPTGVGKTMAAWLGPVAESMQGADATVGAGEAGTRLKRRRKRDAAEPLRVVWITPLRALASDTLASLAEPVDHLGLNWLIEKRTGDTSATLKRKQRDRLPTALVTTPESLTLLLSYADSRERFATLRAVIVDEWHELMGTKRGVQTELALARLRAMVPGLRTWGVSATLGNLEQARDVLLGAAHDPASAALIRGALPKELRIQTVIPRDVERFPWAGHLGIRALEEVAAEVEHADTALLFTNTRSQAEIWFRRLMELKPDWLGRIAIHHGSLDRRIRDQVEALLADGRLKCVVCTSSLDLGVDFAPVDRVFQIGSPKGVARLVQRAGRSGHRPGATSSVLGVPTHTFELIEFAAARDAANAGKIEARTPLERPLDVLVQHLVTAACGGGFREEDLKAEVRTTHAYTNLSDQEWTWAMDFVRRGGPALKAYPEYARIVQRTDGEDAGLWVPASDRMARMHRMAIGTITGEQSLSVQYRSGRKLGSIEESFIARLSVGSRFVFAGKVLELLKVRGMVAYVQQARNKSSIVPRWNGGRFPLSSQLAAAVRARLDEARLGRFEGPELEAARPLLELQARLSRVPAPGELLAEHVELRGPARGGGGWAAFLFMFEGRSVHEGLGALFAYRLSKLRPISVVSNVNDYGIGIQSDTPLELDEPTWRTLLSASHLVEDLLACLNSTELSRRQFRDIARVAGLILPGFPGGAQKPARHLQASSEMFFDVLTEFDPGNMLIDQARREVLENQLEIGRLRGALERARTQTLTIVEPDRLTPLAFPIWAEHLRSVYVSSEKWSQMVARMAVRLEESAGPAPESPPARGRSTVRKSRTGTEAGGRR